MSNKTKKFYKPGKLEQKGTKVSLKTQPYMNVIVFDTNDPITSFHSYVAATNYVVHQYEFLKEIPGMKEIISDRFGEGITSEKIANIKFLLDFLARSPIEVILKEQKVDQQILNDLAVSNLQSAEEEQGGTETCMTE